MEGLETTEKITIEKFDEWMSKNGHWIELSDIQKYGLIAKKEDDQEKPYYCKDNGECLGHTTYTHPEFGGEFHLEENCKAQENK